MKKLLCIATGIVIVFISCATNSITQTEGYDTVKVAYIVREIKDTTRDSFIAFEDRTFPQQSAEDVVASIVQTMRYPSFTAHRSAVADNIKLRDIKLDGNTVVVDFSEEYNAQTEMEKTTMDAAVLLSLTAYKNIEFVKITADGRVRDGRPDIYLTREDVVFNDSVFEE